jgi:hypothetical protein
LHVAHYFLGAPQQGERMLGQHETPPAPIEKRYSEFRLQGANHSADARLRQPEAICGSRHTPELRHALNGTKLTKIHGNGISRS